MKTRIQYFSIIFSIIILGLLSRKFDCVPLFVGDILYAVMIYFLVRFFLPKCKPKVVLIISTLICYTIELMQLYQSNWIIEIRNTTLGRLVLGQGFLWSDLIAYSFGIIVCYILEKFIFPRRVKRNIIKK